MRTYTLLCLFAVALSGCNQSPGETPTEAAGKKEKLPTNAHFVVAPHMHNHAENMYALFVSTATLDYEGAAEAATAITKEPFFARPSEGDDPTTTLNAQMPEGFYKRQDALKAAAQHAASSALKKDPSGLQNAFQTVMGTCMACHIEFLTAKGEVQSPDKD